MDAITTIWGTVQPDLEALAREIRQRVTLRPDEWEYLGPAAKAFWRDVAKAAVEVIGQ